MPFVDEEEVVTALDLIYMMINLLIFYILSLYSSCNILYRRSKGLTASLRDLDEERRVKDEKRTIIGRDLVL